MQQKSNKEIIQLKKLTDSLPPIPTIGDFSSFDKSNNFITYDLDLGTAFGFSLLSEPEIVVQKAFLSVGTSFPLHTHNESIEYILPYKGKIKATFPDREQEIVCTNNEPLCIKAKEPHKIFALQDTWLILIIVPREQNYPA